MSITFNCKCCGAGLEFEKGATIAKCEYCGVIQTLPRLDDDRRKALYARANYFRQNGDFDKAMVIYEQILNEDNTDSEAYWSLVLCRYGVEYVEDPATHRRVPTVNRTQPTPVSQDKDYQMALNYADDSQTKIYRAEANSIDKIQHEILEISRREKPFDVFISYKDSDNNGQRTPDSVWAVDIYERLTQEGFKVFCSRITLEDKLGQKYEPYIFAALNSAPVMIALGTRPEYFNAVWVRNEWSRFLNLIKNGAKKTLIPAFKDMSPYDLPEEFSHLQAQDMSKIGFMQDLVRGVKKLIQPEANKTETVIVNSEKQKTAPLLKRAFMFLEDGDFENAEVYCERVLDIKPENAYAYLGKLMVEKQARRYTDLENSSLPISQSNNYQKAIKFGDKKIIPFLEKIDAKIKNRIEQLKIEVEHKRIEAEIKAKKKRKSKMIMFAVVIVVVFLFSNYAVYEYEKYTILKLYTKGADINAKDNYGYTALMRAATGGKSEVVKILLDAGADVNAKDNYGWTALMLAASNGEAEVVKILLDAGADVNAKNEYGSTALIEAAYSSKAELVNILLDAGADANAKNIFGKRAVDYAREKLKGTDALERLERLSR